jgi:hypothetical protein
MRCIFFYIRIRINDFFYTSIHTCISSILKELYVHIYVYGWVVECDNMDGCKCSTHYMHILNFGRVGRAVCTHICISSHRVGGRV